MIILILLLVLNFFTHGKWIVLTGNRFITSVTMVKDSIEIQKLYIYNINGRFL